MTEREEIIKQLTELRSNIKPMSLCTPMETAIKNVYGDSIDLVLKKTINYLEKTTDDMINTSAEESIEMLETLLSGIVTTTAKRYCMTIIEGVRHNSTEFVLKEAIKHIRKGE